MDRATESDQGAVKTEDRDTGQRVERHPVGVSPELRHPDDARCKEKRDDAGVVLEVESRLVRDGGEQVDHEIRYRAESEERLAQEQPKEQQSQVEELVRGEDRVRDYPGVRESRVQDSPGSAPDARVAHCERREARDREVRDQDEEL